MNTLFKSICFFSNLAKGDYNDDYHHLYQVDYSMQYRVKHFFIQFNWEIFYNIHIRRYVYTYVWISVNLSISSGSAWHIHIKLKIATYNSSSHQYDQHQFSLTFHFTYFATWPLSIQVHQSLVTTYYFIEWGVYVCVQLWWYWYACLSRGNSIHGENYIPSIPVAWLNIFPFTILITSPALSSFSPLPNNTAITVFVIWSSSLTHKKTCYHEITLHFLSVFPYSIIYTYFYTCTKHMLCYTRIHCKY